MVVSTDVVRGPVIEPSNEGYIRSSAVNVGTMELHLTEKGWLFLKQRPGSLG
jgi:hypothetical protein